MRHAAHLVLAVLLILSACAPANLGTYRDPTAPIGASTRFDREGFSGSWIVVESFGSATGAQIVFDTTSDAETIRLSGTGSSQVDGTYRVGVPGELLSTEAGRAPLVVMWTDEDLETAAIGTVTGSFGALIDRDGRIPPDKALAARGILEFYGWDVSQLNRSGS